jgi:hypothetical protein
MGAIVAASILAAFEAAADDHPCDPVTGPGWRVVAAREIADTHDSPPSKGEGGDWFVERTTIVIPFCHYYNPTGVYSMRSYTLSPETTTERVRICAAGASGASVPVAPYAGACPPR